MEKVGLLHKKTKQKPNFIAYEKEHEISKLKMFFIVVRYGQGKAIQNILSQIDTAFTMDMQASGGTFDEVGLFGIGDHKKELVIGIVREDKSELLVRMVSERFAVSKAAKGILYSVPLTSVAGVTIYKFLTNTRKGKKVTKNDKK